MEIRRFFADPNDITGDEIVLSGDEFSHMTRVLRYKAGYKAVILVSDGKERHCTVIKIENDRAVLHIDKIAEVDEKHVSLTLFAGNLKNNKLDLVIQKAVELGVDRVVPFVSDNCAEKKFSRDRGNRIALEAAKQCGAVYLSEVEDIVTFEDVLKRVSEFDQVLFAYEQNRENPISKAAKGKNIAIIVGPEGGFTRDEACRAEEAGVTTVTLGRRILRAETASIVAAALALNGLGELDYE